VSSWPAGMWASGQESDAHS